MSEIKKTCEKCKHCDCPPFIEPCSKCLSKAYNYQEFKALWEPKEGAKYDNLERVAKLIHENGIYGFSIPIPSDTVLKTERDLKIDHINERVDDIQANVLEYGNNCVSKLIELKEKVGLSPDADIYLKDIRQDLCDLDIKLDCIDSILKDIQKDLNELKLEKAYNKGKEIIKRDGADKVPFVDKYKFPIDSSVKFKNGNVIYTVIDVKKLKTGYAYDLLRIFDFGNGKRDYKITGVLESRLEEVK